MEFVVEPFSDQIQIRERTRRTVSKLQSGGRRGREHQAEADTRRRQRAGVPVFSASRRLPTSVHALPAGPAPILASPPKAGKLPLWLCTAVAACLPSLPFFCMSFDTGGHCIGCFPQPGRFKPDHQQAPRLRLRCGSRSTPLYSVY